MATFTGANSVSASALTAWMQQSIGTPQANADQWCYGMGQLIIGGYTCPAPELFGFTGAQRFQTVDATSFLSMLNSYLVGGAQQTTAVTAPAINRGGTVTRPSGVVNSPAGGYTYVNPTSTASATGTNNWMIILLLAAGAFFILRRQSG